MSDHWYETIGAAPTPRQVAMARLEEAFKHDKDIEAAATAQLFDQSLRESYETIATLRARIAALERQIDGAAKSCKTFREAVAGEHLPAPVMFKLTGPFLHLERQLRRPAEEKRGKIIDLGVRVKR